MPTIPNWGAAANTLDGTEQLPLWQGGAGAHGTVANIKTYITGAANTWTANQAINATVTTGTTTNAGLGITANSLTTGTAQYIGSSSLTTGKLLNLVSTSTAAQTNATGLNIDISGTLTNAAQTIYGGKISVTTTNGTSGTNVGLYISASGATTANYGLLIGAGFSGFGTTAPSSMVEIYRSDASSNPAIANACSLVLNNPNGGAGTGGQILWKNYTGTNTTAAGISFYTGISNATGTTGNMIFSLQRNVGDGSLTSVLTLTGATGAAYLNTGVTTGTTTSAGLAVSANSLTTGTAQYIGSSSLTTGKLLNLVSTSTAAQTNATGLNIDLSGTLTNAAQTIYGQQISVTTTNATSGTNVGLYISASGATTANYGLLVAAGSSGFGTTTPRRRVDILDASAAQLRLTYTDNSVYTDFTTNSSGYLTMTPSGGKVILSGSTLTTNAGVTWDLGAANVVSPTSPNRTLTVVVAGTTYYIAAKTTND